MGVRTENAFAKPDGVVTFGASVAWVHDFTPNRAAQASLLALPNASFIVNGAAQAYGSAQTTASLGRKWTNGWSVSASLRGDFSNVSSSYGGLGVIRYAW